MVFETIAFANFAIRADRAMRQGAYRPMSRRRIRGLVVTAVFIAGIKVYRELAVKRNRADAPRVLADLD